jgi:hypothetical protein
MYWNVNSAFLLTLSRPWHRWADSVHTKRLDEKAGYQRARRYSSHGGEDGLEALGVGI